MSSQERKNIWFRYMKSHLNYPLAHRHLLHLVRIVMALSGLMSAFVEASLLKK